MPERFGASVPDSQVQPRWAASLCLPPCLGRGRSARASEGRGVGGWPVSCPSGHPGDPKLLPHPVSIGLGRPRPQPPAGALGPLSYYRINSPGLLE